MHDSWVLKCSSEDALGALELDSDSLRRLFIELNLEECSSIDQLNDQLQQKFLRPVGSERQQLHDQLEESRSHLIPILQQLGFIDEVTPKQKKYNSVLLLGAAQGGFTDRMEQLKYYLKNNIISTIDNIYLLGGQRDLWPYAEYSGKKSGEPITIDMVAKRYFRVDELVDWQRSFVKNIFEQFLTSEVVQRNDSKEIQFARNSIMSYFSKNVSEEEMVWPKEIDMMKEIIGNDPVLSRDRGVIKCVDTPIREDGTRPNTEDTIKKWKIEYGDRLSSNENSVLVISSQPHIFQQSQPVKTILGDRFNIETVGKGVDSAQVNLSVIMDAMARGVYQIRQREMAKEPLSR